MVEVIRQMVQQPFSGVQSPHFSMRDGCEEPELEAGQWLVDGGAVFVKQMGLNARIETASEQCIGSWSGMKSVIQKANRLKCSPLAPMLHFAREIAVISSSCSRGSLAMLPIHA